MIIRRKDTVFLLFAIGTTVIMFASHSVAAEPNKGMALYRGHCAACHGIDGGGNGPKAAGMNSPPTNFRNVTLMRAMPDSQLERAILAGKPGTAMKGYGTVMNAQDVAALIKYLRSLSAVP